MYVYQITNIVNNKIYIGITNNIKKRWDNHKCSNDPDMVIARAIRKYGQDNFRFEVLFRNLSIEEAKEKEIQLIKEKDCRVPNGYNVSKGGDYIENSTRIGAENGRAKLTEEEAQYILDHRNLPMYALYEDFKDKISYESFKKLYHHNTYTNLNTKVQEYPYNWEFGNQFCSKGLEYDEVIDIRKRYQNGEYWREVYKDYSNIYTNEWSFWNAYNGNSYKLVMPEVFTEENRKLHSRLAKYNKPNGRAVLQEEDVLEIRRLHKEGVTNSEIYKAYPHVSSSSIRRIINGETWKYLL